MTKKWWEIERTKPEVDYQIQAASQAAYRGAPSKYPALTYEHGVIDAIRWLLSEEDDSPMGDIDDAA